MWFELGDLSPKQFTLLKCNKIFDLFQTSSGDVSPSTTPCGTPLSGAPKFGTVIPNRIFVGGIAANVSYL